MSTALKHAPAQVEGSQALPPRCRTYSQATFRVRRYFYVTLGLGTPSKQYQLILDTGSTVTYVPCSDCKHCGKHTGVPFDVKASSTAEELSCSSPKCNCGSPPCQCFQNKCYYARSYGKLVPVARQTAQRAGSALRK